MLSQVKLSPLVWALNPNMSGVLLRRKLKHRHNEREDGNLKMKAETGVMQL